MVTADIQNLAAISKDTKAYVFFEKRSESGPTNGVYYIELNRNDSSNINPDTIFDTATKIIDKDIYENRNLEAIYLYANDDGSDLTVTIIAKVNPGVQRKMYTGRVVNGEYTPCDNNVPTLFNGTLRRFSGIYFNDNNKLKFYTYFDGNNVFGGCEAH